MAGDGADAGPRPGSLYNKERTAGVVGPAWYFAPPGG